MARLRDVSRVFKGGNRVSGKIGCGCVFEATQDGGFVSARVGTSRSCTATQKRLAKDIAAALFAHGGRYWADGDIDQYELRKALKNIGRLSYWTGK